MAKKGFIKTITTLAGVAVLVFGGVAGGVALTEKQAQTKYEQMLEDEKQSAVDEYKLTIDIGHSDETLEEAERVAREEGKQEGLTEGYDNGYNAGFADGSTSSSKKYESLMTEAHTILFAKGNIMFLSNDDGIYLVDKVSDEYRLFEIVENGTTYKALDVNNFFYDNSMVGFNCNAKEGSYNEISRVVFLDLNTKAITIMPEGSCLDIMTDLVNGFDRINICYVSWNGSVHILAYPYDFRGLRNLANSVDLGITFVSWADGNFEMLGSKIESETDEQLIFTGANRTCSPEDPATDIDFVAMRYTYNKVDGTLTAEDMGITHAEWDEYFSS